MCNLSQNKNKWKTNGCYCDIKFVKTHSSRNNLAKQQTVKEIVELTRLLSLIIRFIFARNISSYFFVKSDFNKARQAVQNLRLA